eukprot:2645017-Ditylum_brightwellii.AAC.1
MENPISGGIMPSSYTFGDVDPSTINVLKKGLVDDESSRKQKCGDYCLDEVQRFEIQNEEGHHNDDDSVESDSRARQTRRHLISPRSNFTSTTDAIVD